MNILALDFGGSKTGFAHSNGISGIWDMSIRKDESSGLRLIRFEGKLREIVRSVPTDVIIFEAVTAGVGPKANLGTIKLHSKLQAIVEKFVEETEGLECGSYNLKTIKAFALPGGGKKNKEAMVTAAKKRWPEVDIIDDNMADALWLLELARSHYDFNSGRNSKQDAK